MNNVATGFPPIADESAKTLILGTMPGAESLRLSQYYANPRNAFWRIVARLFNFPDTAAYDEKTGALKQNNIALWDVMQSCERPGSLDAHIKQHTIEVNDFPAFFQKNSNIKRICFNGATAEKEYKKRVLENLPDSARDIALIRLPSTSPAMARMSFEEKYNLWSKALTDY